MRRLAGGVVPLAQLFKSALGFAQARRFRLEFDTELIDVARAAFTRTACFAFFLQPQQILRGAQLLLQTVIQRGDRGLAAQVLELFVELEPDVLDAQKVLDVSASRNSVSRRRSRYFDTPAASSRKMRSSSGLASMMREIMPCSMIA